MIGLITLISLDIIYIYIYMYRYLLNDGNFHSIYQEYSLNVLWKRIEENRFMALKKIQSIAQIRAGRLYIHIYIHSNNPIFTTLLVIFYFYLLTTGLTLSLWYMCVWYACVYPKARIWGLAAPITVVGLIVTSISPGCSSTMWSRVTSPKRNYHLSLSLSLSFSLWRWVVVIMKWYLMTVVCWY